MLLLVLGVGLAAWSWRRWGHPIVDYGREVYVPWRLTEGEVLFRDIAWFNGPLSPYLNALWFSLFGVSLDTQVVCDTLILALFVGLVWHFVREVADAWTATAAGVVLLTMHGFAQTGAGIFNWVTPYSHEMTHGIVLSCAAMAFVFRFQRTGGTAAAAAAGLALGLVFLTKPEIMLAATAAVVVGLAASMVSSGRPRALTLLAVLGGAIVPSIVACSLLSLSLSAGNALLSMSSGWIHAFNPDLRALRFYREGMGTGDLPRELSRTATQMACWAAILVPAAVAALLLRRRSSIAVALSALISAVLVVLIIGRFGAEAFGFRALPLFLLAAGGFWLWAFWRGRHSDARRSIVALTLITFGFCLLLKMFFAVRVSVYGFGLSTVAMVVLVGALLRWLPDAIARAGGRAWVFRSPMLALLACIVASDLRVTAGQMGKRDHVIHVGAESLRSTESYFIEEMLSELKARAKPDATVTVIPEGVMLNYLGRWRTSIPYLNMTPPELIMFGEDEILQSLETSPPDWIIVTGRRTLEYGLPLFGTHYGQAILDWVRRHYATVIIHGSPPLRPEREHDGAFGLELMRRM